MKPISFLHISCYAGILLSLQGCHNPSPLAHFDNLKNDAQKPGLIAAGASWAAHYSDPVLQESRSRLRSYLSVLENELKTQSSSPEFTRLNQKASEMLFDFMIAIASGPAGSNSQASQSNLLEQLEAFTNVLGSVAVNPIDLARAKLAAFKYVATEKENLSLDRLVPVPDGYHRLLVSVNVTAVVRPSVANAAIVYLDLYPAGADQWCHKVGERLQAIQRNVCQDLESFKDEALVQQVQVQIGQEWGKWLEELKTVWHPGTTNAPPPPSIDWDDMYDPYACMHRYLQEHGLTPKLVRVEPFDEGELLQTEDSSSAVRNIGGGLAGTYKIASANVSGRYGSIVRESSVSEHVNRLSLAFAVGDHRAGWYFLPSEVGRSSGAMKPTDRRINMVVDVPKVLSRLNIFVHKDFLDSELLSVKEASTEAQMSNLNQARQVVSLIEETYSNHHSNNVVGRTYANKEHRISIRRTSGVDFPSRTGWEIAKSATRNSLSQFWAEKLSVDLPRPDNRRGVESQKLAAIENEHLPFAIHGAIVNEEGTREGWVVCHRGVIIDTTADESELPSNAIKIRHGGYIFPGLIDCHNHPHYNSLPKWTSTIAFTNRYQWQMREDYSNSVARPFAQHIEEAGNRTNSLKYGEIRALIGGATTIQGSFTPLGSRVLARNIGPDYKAGAYTPAISNLTDHAALQKIVDGLGTGALRRYFFHIAEGTDMTSSNEFAVLRQKGLVRPGVVIIHGITLSSEEFADMSENGMHLVWSPTSNLNLYGRTADVVEAMKHGVKVALAPDWTITGSDNMLQELRNAFKFSNSQLSGRLTPRDLFRMATTDAAIVAGMYQFVGQIKQGFAADFFLAPKLSEDPFESLLRTDPDDIRLVFVDGVPLYGDRELLQKFVVRSAIEHVQVGSQVKGLVTVGDLRLAPEAHQTFHSITNALMGALKSLAPLQEEE